MDGSNEPELRGRVAVVRLALADDGRITSDTLRTFASDLDRLSKRDDVTALVVEGTGGRFAAGADHADLAGAEMVGEMALLADRIAELPFPTVAAIEGLCLAAGAEIALACRYRVAEASAKIGFPDVMVGLPPVAGAAKRLPKLIGADRALRLLLGGKPIKAPDAQKIGLLDLTFEGDAATAAIQFLDQLNGSGDIARNGLREAGGDFLKAVALHRARAKAAPIEAPERIIECVEAGRIVPDEIFRNMQEVAFEDLWSSDHARALSHIDKAERAAARMQRTVKPKSRPVSRIGIAGVRGAAPGLAIAALEAGFDVTVAESDEEALEAGVIRVIEHFDALVAKGRLSEAASEAVLDRMHAVSGFRTLGAADLVFDVVNPRGAASKSLIADLDRFMKPGAVLVTGSTQVGPDAIAAITSRPSDVVAVRFFGETADRRAVEVTAGQQADPLALGTVINVLTRMRRLPIMTGPNCRGVGARMMSALHATADHLLEQGASIAQIDGVAQDWGLPLGTFAARDVRGIIAPSPKTSDPGASLGLDRVLAAQGRKGRAVGRGYYAYVAGKMQHDEDVAQMVDALRARKGISPRVIKADEIRLSLIAAMANVGAAVVAEGALPRPVHVDLLSVHGLGLSRRAGGVMKSADLVGLAKIRARLKALAEASGVLPGPHPLLGELQSNGKSFADLNDG